MEPRMKIGSVTAFLPACLLLACVFFAFTSIDRALAGPGAPRRTAPLLAADENPAPEKKRVPKKETEDKKKSDDDKKKNDKDDDDDDHGFADCFFSCLGGLFSSHHDQRSEAPGYADQGSAPRGPVSWSAGGLGTIVPSDTLARDVDLWDRPGDESNAARVGRLRIGAEVRVIDVHSTSEGAWLHVRPVSTAAAEGWVAAEDVVPRTPPSATMAGGLPPLDRARPASPRASTMLTLGGFGTGPADLNLDYSNGGTTVGLHHLWRPGGSLAVGPRVGFSQETGSPRFNFETITATDSTLESPSNARLQILDASLRVGQYFPIGDRVMAYYGVGPSVFWVREKADIHFETRRRSDGALIASGKRTESKEKWRFGAEVTLGAGWSVRGGNRLGLATRAYAIPWESAGKQPLTTDFIGKKTIVGFDLGVIFGHDWF
jgi:opacity protein-like surface antigen